MALATLHQICCGVLPGRTGGVHHGFDCGLTSDELEGLQMNNVTGCHPSACLCVGIPIVRSHRLRS